jgi:hypothetical protein
MIQHVRNKRDVVAQLLQSETALESTKSWTNP